MMMKFNILGLLFFSVLVTSCVSNDLELTEKMICQDDSATDTGVFSESDAIDFAFDVLSCIDKTRSQRSGTASVFCMESDVRSEKYANDTLAYVVNFNNGQGYVIVDRYNLDNRVVGFSNDGCFDPLDEDNKWFTDNVLMPYLKEKSHSSRSSNQRIVGGATLYDGMEQVKPKTGYGIHQGDPFDKTVIKYHPDCPVGCGPVAVATISIWAKKRLKLLERTFYAESIRKGLTTQVEIIKPPVVNPFVIEGYPDPVYFYDGAVKETADLLYYLGKELGTTYSTTGSSTGVTKTKEFFNNKQFLISVPFTYVWDDGIVVNGLRDKSVFLMIAFDPNPNKAAHAFVCDGCYYTTSKTNDKIIEKSYLHFVWGWKYPSQGYYTGDIWSAGGFDFGRMGSSIMGIETEK